MSEYTTIRDAILRTDLASFIAKSFKALNPNTVYLPNWHIDLIAEYLEKLRTGECNRLIINMPPRALKSICINVAWPAWILGHEPTRRILTASYTSSLSLKHSLDCRTLLQTNWYQQLFPLTRIAYGQDEKHKFVTTGQGYRLATSISGNITGEGGDFLIIDDPLSPYQASSALHRNYVQNWFDHTFASRLDDKKRGAIVLVMQRLHADDLSGYLLKKGGWQHLCLPAIAPVTIHFDLNGKRFTRKEGDILHPDRENYELIQQAKNELGSSAFAAQYQQQPIPVEGQMIKRWWFRHYKEIPKNIKCYVQSWDTGIKAGPQNDASVCATFAETDEGYYIIDIQILKLEYPDLKRAFYALAEQWNPHAILIEDKASGQQLLQDVRRESLLPVISISPKGDKIARVAAISAIIESGKLYIPEHSSWLADFETEIISFPEVNSDDQVDALSQYLNWVRCKAHSSIAIRRI